MWCGKKWMSRSRQARVRPGGNRLITTQKHETRRPDDRTRSELRCHPGGADSVGLVFYLPILIYQL